MQAKPRVIVISIDGVAPRFVDQTTMPALCRLARSGASTFAATTVMPPVTLPAHASLLRGVDPAVHGIADNDTPLRDDVPPSFLVLARSAGMSTFAAHSWGPLESLIERSAATTRFHIDGGYDPSDDDAIVHVAGHSQADLSFVYFCGPDLAGHSAGWGSDDYLRALQRADDRLQKLVESAPEASIIVTTDHGGHDRVHDGSDPRDATIFMIVRHEGVDPLTTWDRPVSILDVAPTVASLLGIDAPDEWQGTSLIDDAVPVLDVVVGRLHAMAGERYGEQVTMLEHSLQTAELLEAEGSTDEMCVAGLLHDIGHLAGGAGEWGLPDHATEGAEWLTTWFPASVVEPIRLHVDAKRCLVAEDPDYASALSEASRQTLRQQGGPFSPQEVEQFRGNPWAKAAVRLRSADDNAKVPDRGVADLTARADLIRNVLERNEPSVAFLRDSCECPNCRDVESKQRLLSVDDLADWRIAGMRDGEWVLVHPTEGEHVIRLARNARQQRSSAGDRTLAIRTLPAELDLVRRDLVEFGFAHASGLGVAPGTVLELAAELGHVRVTNYGDLFDVQNVVAAENLAYTARALPLHTDNPYRDPVPTVQLLHCLQPATVGGASRLSDGFAAAERLRSSSPDAFDLLANQPVRFSYSSATVALEAERPIIEVNGNGSVVAVAVNHRSMVAPDLGPITDRWYDAYRSFVDLIETGPVTEIELRAGEVIAFDNRRILHARSHFPSSDPRHLQGCYIDIDAVRSSVALCDH